MPGVPPRPQPPQNMQNVMNVPTNVVELKKVVGPYVEKTGVAEEKAPALHIIFVKTPWNEIEVLHQKPQNIVGEIAAALQSMQSSLPLPAPPTPYQPRTAALEEKPPRRRAVPA